ncbi:MAG: response regulator transcription factor [Oscillospiraceae bacterium]|jgi:DNA-binding response OmpR family regulator|nr:response regulator transcription factor [Oscillospiraceae bacterium]
MYTILICDDEPDIRAALRIYLTGEGYDVLEAGTGDRALELMAEREVHLVLMDIMMPGMDGMTATAKLRETSNVPVILITAKSEDNDKILGLTVGADDYVTKPFNPLEVLARVRAQLRRYAQLGGMAVKNTALVCGGIVMDDEAKRVTLHGEEIALTPTEYDILRLLLQNPGKVFSSREIYSQVWRDEPLSAEGTVPVHIRHLREKLEIDPASPRLLKVVWGKGYKLEDKRK